MVVIWHRRPLISCQPRRIDFGALICVNSSAETFNVVNPAALVAPTKVIDVKLCTDELFHINNEVSLTDHDGQEILLNGNQLDWLFKPADYDVHILGVDINGVFINAIEYLKQKGYNITVYSDVIKPYSKKTIQHIKTSGVKFTSIKSVSLA